MSAAEAWEVRALVTTTRDIAREEIVGVRAMAIVDRKALTFRLLSGC